MSARGASEEPLEALRSEGYARVGWRRAEDAALLAEHFASTCFDQGQELCRDPHFVHDWAADELRHPPTAPLLHQFLGDVVAIENVFVIAKHPGSDFTVPLHQDGINPRLELDGQRSVTAWYALTPATPDNGCLRVVPGSHRAGYRAQHLAGKAAERAHGRPVQAAWQPEDQAALVAVPLQAGQACLMDVQTLHTTPPNRTAHLRIGMNVRYAGREGIRHAQDLDRSLALMGSDENISVRDLQAGTTAGVTRGNDANTGR